jgi:para-aminobenzoate synthetase component 1
MVTQDRITALPFTRSLAGWADYFAHLPGFVYLDSGAVAKGSELELITALPTYTFLAQDYSSNLTIWMTHVERALADAREDSPILGSSELFNGSLIVGNLDYDTPARRLAQLAPAPSHAFAGLYHWVLVTHVESSTTEVLYHPRCPAETRRQVQSVLECKAGKEAAPFKLSQPFSPDITRADYRRAIERIQEYILAGDCYQVNFAQRFQAAFTGDCWSGYRTARAKLAGNFSGFMRPSNDRAILSLSPERFLQISGEKIITQPIKGTAPRHVDASIDRQIAESLVHSEKDRAENVMITDLLRNDLGQFCQAGSVEVTELCALRSFGNVHHLISTVEGELKPRLSAGQILIATSPGGSITGAPKKRAVEVINELELSPRGAYCGSLFVMGGENWMQSSIAIRTLEAVGRDLYCWGGGGITASSSWEAEYQETLDKVGPIMAALEQQNQCSGSSIPS